VTRRLTALAVAGVVLLAACGGSGGSDETVEGQDVVVDMFDNRYQYTEIRIPVGGSVTFVGAGRNPHNAVDSDGEWSTEDVFGSLEQSEGDEAKLVYNQAGTYAFYCTFHGNANGDGMAGTLIVGEG
jgi:plastocyanin